jgi:nucleoside-diphosphate-sugar epimerase
MSYTIYLIGENSFLAKNLYLSLKKIHNNIILLTHTHIDILANAKDTDIIINFCGINRSDKYTDFEQANHYLLKHIVSYLTNKPFFIHISSLMIYGFLNKHIDQLSYYQQWFIQSKLAGEQYLQNNYDITKLCIIRPSNIFGYNCTPYYNNLLSTLVYEKINNLSKINNINKNCIRNMLSIDGFCNKLIEIIIDKTNGSFNIISNNNISLETLISHIYNNIPDTIKLYDGDTDISNIQNTDKNTINLIVYEDIEYKIKELEHNMKIYLDLVKQVSISNLPKLTQPRGDMIEISNQDYKRLYKITLTQHSIRGNHFHYEQTEEFYTNKGMLIYLLAFSEHPSIIHIIKSHENDLIRIKPYIIHTLTNDYIHNYPEIIIMSTQTFIQNEIPDTKYINII